MYIKLNNEIEEEVGSICRGIYIRYRGYKKWRCLCVSIKDKLNFLRI